MIESTQLRLIQPTKKAAQLKSNVNTCKPVGNTMHHKSIIELTPQQAIAFTMEVNVRTRNLLKVETVRTVFTAAFPEDHIQVNAINVPSGVPA